jgi:site-specific recombinase XerD
MKRKRNKQNSRPRRVLRLLDLEHARTAVLNSLSSPESQRGYRHAIDEFVDWYCSEPRLAFNRIVVLRYRSHLESRRLAPATINLRLGAVRRLAYEAADCGLLSADLAAGIRRVKGLKKNGVRMGNWLTDEQARSLWQSPDHARMKGKRDRALLALLLACGLRRHEAANLRVEDLQQREDHWAIVDLVGKGVIFARSRCPTGCTWNCLPGSVLLPSIVGRSFAVSAARVECSGMASAKRRSGMW